MKNALESRLREIGRSLADKQICRFWKIPEEMAVTPCDFCGYTKTGRAIVIEAKMVNSHRLKIGSEPGLTKNQWNELRDAERAHAVTLVVWERDGFLNILEPIDIAFRANGMKSVPWLEAAMPMRVEQLEQCLECIIPAIDLRLSQHQQCA